MSKAGSKYKFYNYSRPCGNYKGESRHGLVVRKYIWSWPHTALVLVICLSSGIPNLATSKTVLCQLGIKVDYCVLFQLSLNIFLKVLFSWTLVVYEENTSQIFTACSRGLLPCPDHFTRTVLVPHIWRGWAGTGKIWGASPMGKRTLIPSLKGYSYIASEFQTVAAHVSRPIPVSGSRSGPTWELGLRL